jgi:alpha-1,6-mannosyltransferase
VKIVDITEFYSERGGGIRSHLTNRGHFLCQLHHSHLVLAPGPRDEDARLCSCVAPEVGGSHLTRFGGPPQPYDRTYHLLYRLDKVRQRVRAERPDVLEAHSPYLATAAVMACGPRAARLRTAFWHSDHVGVYAEPVATRLLGLRAAQFAVRPLWQGVRALLAPFDAIFAAGRMQAEQLRAAGVARVIHVPFGVDARTFTPAARSAEWRRQWLNGDGDGAPILVGLGRFAHEKRWDVVLDAFARVRARRKAVLVLYGDGPERRRLEERAPPGVRFVGFEQDRDKLARALASADVLVHASPCETFGLSIAEAVACGLPIVVPDAGAAADHAQPGCGEVYRSLDASACAVAIERILDRPKNETRASALDAAGRVPTAEGHFRQVLETYGDLLLELGR